MYRATQLTSLSLKSLCLFKFFSEKELGLKAGQVYSSKKLSSDRQLKLIEQIQQQI